MADRIKSRLSSVFVSACMCICVYLDGRMNTITPRLCVHTIVMTACIKHAVLCCLSLGVTVVHRCSVSSQPNFKKLWKTYYLNFDLKVQFLDVRCGPTQLHLNAPTYEAVPPHMSSAVCLNLGIAKPVILLSMFF